MNVNELLSRFTTEELKKLAAATSAEELSQTAGAMGHNLTAEEAEAAFAALFPVRGKDVLDEAELAAVVGGYLPQSSKSLSDYGNTSNI